MKQVLSKLTPQQITNTFPGQKIAIAGKSKPSSQPGERMEILVTKAHTVGVQSGRILSVLTVGDDSFVDPIGTAENDQNLTLPTRRRLTADPP